MLLIKTRLAQSTIPNAGLGLFLEDSWPAGTVFARFDPSVDRVVSEEEISADPKMADWSYYDEEIKAYIYCSDNARFINHSCEHYNYITNESGENIFIRDVANGEEILANYCSWHPFQQAISREMLNCQKPECHHGVADE